MHVCMHACMLVCMYVMYVCMYVYMYICTGYLRRVQGSIYRVRGPRYYARKGFQNFVLP